MATCDHCGKSFGNEGAAASHAAHCPEKDGQGTQPTERTQARAPAPAAAGEARAPAPAGPDNVRDAVAQAGEQMAGMRHASEEERVRAEGMAWEMAGQFLSGYGRGVVREKLAGIRRAKEHDGDVSVNQEFPTCPECDGALKDLPEPGDPFDCPHCRAPLRA